MIVKSDSIYKYHSALLPQQRESKRNLLINIGMGFYYSRKSSSLMRNAIAMHRGLAK